MSLGFIILGISNSLIISIICIFISGCSVSLLLPQVNLQVVKDRSPEEFASASAISNAVGCMGAFFAPTMTSVATVISGTPSVSTRMIFCGIGAMLCALVFLPFCLEKKTK